MAAANDGNKSCILRLPSIHPKYTLLLIVIDWQIRTTWMAKNLMQKTEPHFGVGIALSITLTHWASAFAVIKSAGHAYGAGELALLRFTVAGVVLGLYAAATRVKLPRPRDLPYFFLTGLLGVALYHPFLNYGEEVVSAGVASLLINSAPVWTAILASFLLRERVGSRKTLGIALSFVGILLLMLGDRGEFTIRPAALLIVGSAISMAFYMVVQKRFLAHYSAMEFILWTFWAGVILLLPIFAAATIRAASRAPAQATLEVIYLGIFPGAIAYMCFAYATVRLRAATVVSFMYLVPGMAMLMAWGYSGEVPTALGLLGGTLAIGGVAIVNTANRDPAPLPPVLLNSAPDISASAVAAAPTNQQSP